ncbi:MAG: phosphoglycerate dehydrogenase [Bdellovibrionales bacterium]|nr:phosphoglycerate dehydrogenase [Bdellovibrionales bacterium]
MKDKQKILLLENIHSYAKEKLEAEGFQVDLLEAALDESGLDAKLSDYSAVGIRSKTQLTESVLRKNNSLVAIGAFCIGTNQIDLETSNKKGVPVFNAPYSNTRSVAELVLAEMIALSRKLGDINTMAHKGQWNKSAQGSNEIRGKSLGIIGYGHIGSQVSVLAEALGLQVRYYDVIRKLPMGNARAEDSLESLLWQSDFISLHVPETPLTVNMMDAERIRQMKKGSFLINASRGTVVDIDALHAALMEGHLAGAAIDVFPTEPESNKERFESKLQGLSNVILTPHIGGSTEEAQASIGVEVADALTAYLKSGRTTSAVNFPRLDIPDLTSGFRLINVHQNVPGVLGQINGIVSKEGVNIRAQYLSTDPKIGYLVLDMEEGDAQAVADQVAALKVSIQSRLVEPRT